MEKLCPSFLLMPASNIELVGIDTSTFDQNAITYDTATLGFANYIIISDNQLHAHFLVSI